MQSIQFLLLQIAKLVKEAEMRPTELKCAQNIVLAAMNLYQDHLADYRCGVRKVSQPRFSLSCFFLDAAAATWPSSCRRPWWTPSKPTSIRRCVENGVHLKAILRPTHFFQVFAITYAVLVRAATDLMVFPALESLAAQVCGMERVT